jgi:hypothetical protein
MAISSFNSSYTAVIVDNTTVIGYDFKLNKDELEFEKKYEVTEKDFFHFKTAILIINTSDVLHQHVESENFQDALEEAYPAIKISDIYHDFQNVNSKIVSVVKKVTLDKLLSNDSLHKKYFSAIRLGPSVAAISSERIEVSDEEMSSYAIATYIKHLDVSTNLIDINNGFKNSIFNKRFFEITKWSAIAVFLVGLCINFYFHEHYRKELDRATITARSFKDIDKKIESLQESVSSNEQLLGSDNTDDINKLHQINEILLADENIRFIKLNYQPLKSALGSDQMLRLNNNKIIIEGYTPDKSVLNNYMDFVRDQNMIKEVSVLLITEESNKVLFKIQISTNET